MAFDRAVDTNGNIILNTTGFDFTFNSGVPDYTIQRIRTKLRTFLGEYFLNIQMGVDYIGTIFKKGAVQKTVDALIKAQINSEPTVSQITSYTSSFNANTRLYTITWAALLTNGTSSGIQTVSI